MLGEPKCCFFVYTTQLGRTSVFLEKPREIEQREKIQASFQFEARYFFIDTHLRFGGTPYFENKNKVPKINITHNFDPLLFIALAISKHCCAQFVLVAFILLIAVMGTVMNLEIELFPFEPD